MVKRKLIDSDELEGLEARYGPFPRVEVDVPMQPRSLRFYRKVFKRRRGEILFVLRRPSGELLLHTKHKYPPGLYRIPGGGIDWGEPVAESLEREVQEETQLAVVDERLLGMIHYRFSHPSDKHDDVPFVSFVFEVPGIEGEPEAADQSEGISGFKWIPVADLTKVAEALRALPEDEEGSGDWGRFRAIGLDFVYEQLG